MLFYCLLVYFFCHFLRLQSILLNILWRMGVVVGGIVHQNEEGPSVRIYFQRSRRPYLLKAQTFGTQ